MKTTIINSTPIVTSALNEFKTLEHIRDEFNIIKNDPITLSFVNTISDFSSSFSTGINNIFSQTSNGNNYNNSLSYFGTDYKSLSRSLASDAYRLQGNDAADVQYDRIMNALVTLSNNPLPSYGMSTLTDVLLNASYTSAENLSRSMNGVEDNGILFTSDDGFSSSGPGGGTGGSDSDLPPPTVGGVYLSRAAEVTGDLYGLEGAAYDPVTGRLVLIGGDRKGQALPALRIEDLAVAFRAVFGTAGSEPGVSIDPDPADPMGKEMLVRFLGGVENTAFGRTLFEADRMMKSLSLGKDSLTGQPVSVDVNGYHTMVELAFSNLGKNRDPNLWSRFWLVPEKVIVQVSPDGNSILFPETRIRVKTETMRWVKGKLVSADGVKDECAEYFANHFTRYYDRYAAQFPVFNELKNCANMTALAAWIKKKNAAFNLDWLKPYDRFEKTPEKTPSISMTETVNLSDGKTVTTVSAFFIGGTDLKVENRYVKDDGTVSKTVSAALAAVRPLEKQASVSFTDPAGASRTAITLPTSQTRAPGANILRGSELGLLSRAYCSFHDRDGDFGSCWFLDLPRLIVTNPQSDKVEYATVGKTAVPIRRFRYLTLFGGNDIRFNRYLVDDQSRRIAFYPERACAVKALYSDEKHNAYMVEFAGGQAETFDPAGRLNERRLSDDARVMYGWDDRGRCTGATLTVDGKAVYAVTLEYDAAGRVVTAQSGKRTYRYGYDEHGDLLTVNGGGDIWVYAYDTAHLVSAVTRNGRKTASFSYDSRGRLLKTAGADGRSVTRVITSSDGNTDVSVNGVKDTYFPNGRLAQRTEANGGTERYAYDKDNNVASIEYTAPDGSRSRLEYGNAGRYVKYTDGNGAVRAVLYDELGRLRQIQEGKSALLDRKYGRTSRGWTVATETADTVSRETYDDAGRPLEAVHASKTPGGGKMNITCRYDKKGQPVKTSFRGLYALDLSFKNGSLTGVTAGKSTMSFIYDAERLMKITRPGETWTFSYASYGYLTAVTGQRAGRKTRLAYTDGRLTERHTTAGSVDTFRYDEAGALTAVTKNNDEQWEIKRHKNELACYRNDVRVFQYTFDAQGRITGYAE